MAYGQKIESMERYGDLFIIGVAAPDLGCDIVKVCKDHGISGAKGRDKRPAFDAMRRDAAQRNVVMAWSVDRLGRSLQDLVAFLSELHALRIELFLIPARRRRPARPCFR
jgi:DNA invertase Pin-like site-specific DNA recombinase